MPHVVGGAMSRSAKEDSDATLDRRIQALPQELQDAILDEIILCSPSMITVSKEYKPPKSLSINRETRKRASKTYYTTCIFQIDFAGAQICQRMGCQKWLSSLPDEHRILLRQVRMPQIPPPISPEYNMHTLSEAFTSLNAWNQFLASAGVSLGSGVLHVNMWIQFHPGARYPGTWSETWAPYAML